MNQHYELPEDEEGVRYEGLDAIDFSIIPTHFRRIPFFEDDLYLGMQAMNVGVADPIITQFEYGLLREYVKIERTPVLAVMSVSALSQMWIYGLYEVLRMWRERRFQFSKLHNNGGIDSKIQSLSDKRPNNLAISTRMRQLLRFQQESAYRDAIEETWLRLEQIYRMTELFRINLAKHSAPGNDGIVPRAPGYGRINNWCGALDYELIDKHNHYGILNRRDIADGLRDMFKDQ